MIAGDLLLADFVQPLGDVRFVDVAFEDSEAAVQDAVITSVTGPLLFGFPPKTPNGGAVLILPGGGYTKLVIGKEGVEIARWLTGLGFFAFVLGHRFPNAANGVYAPIEDAVAAMRLIRARGPDLGLARVGALGLSSGGHLAASLATSHVEDADRPDFLIVGYAPISTNAAGRTVVANKPPLSPPEKQAFYDAMQPDAQLADDPRPAFIFYAANDKVVPVENARRLCAAYEARGAQAELHVFDDAPHGFALRTPEIPAGQWPVLCEAWLRRIGALA